jgi:hypothetical protein
MLRPLAALSCALMLGACVSVSETPMTANAVAKGQLVAAVVYSSPGPAMTEKSTNMDQIAKVVPGLGLFMSATQNTRDLDASRSLQRYLPATWKPEAAFLPILMAELATSGNPGRLVASAQAGLTDDVAAGFNHSENVTDWLVRYCVANPDNPAPRNYAAVPGLRGALVLEVNLAYGAPADGSDHWTPNLDAVTKLYRASDLALLWRHEDVVENAAGMKTSAEFEKNPADLIAKWQGLMPALAKAISGNFSRNLQASGVYTAP